MPLPYLSTGELRDQGGAVVIAELPCSVWPASRAMIRDAGRHLSHTGEAPIEYAEDLAEPNAVLIVDNRRYKVISAIPHEIVPHVALDLLSTDG